MRSIRRRRVIHHAIRTLGQGAGIISIDVGDEQLFETISSLDEIKDARSFRRPRGGSGRVEAVLRPGISTIGQAEAQGNNDQRAEDRQDRREPAEHIHAVEEPTAVDHQ